MKPPCKGCPDRWVSAEGNCHTLCGRYQMFLAANRLSLAKRREESLIHEYAINNKIRNDNARRRKKGEKK